jgi:hypothetical protein
MKTLYVGLIVIALLCSISAHAQVDKIKQASSSRSSRGESGSSTSLVFVDFFIEFALFGLVEWQEYTLQQRYENPSVVSVDVMFQGAAQPSNYYILNPRVRGTWGLFSSDFRFNYLLEESIEGVKHLRTDDWQILQFNLVTTRNVTARLGGGILHEAFNNGNTFSEWTAGIHLYTDRRHLGGMAEFRTAEEARSEWSLQVHYRLFETKHCHTYITAGGVFQRYYSSINVWGLQSGLMLKIF